MSGTIHNGAGFIIFYSGIEHGTRAASKYRVSKKKVPGELLVCGKETSEGSLYVIYQIDSK